MTILTVEITKYGWDIEDDDLWVIEQEFIKTLEIDEPVGSSTMNNSGLDGWAQLSDKAAKEFEAFEQKMIKGLSDGRDDVHIYIKAIDGVEAYINYP